MPKTESFDVSTGVDLMEIDNAVNQARKEISTRFDFKGSVAEIDFDRKTSKLGLHASDDYKLEAVWQVLQPRLIARKVPLPNLKRGEIEPASGNTVRQAIDITQAIDQDTARKIVKFLKEGKYKKVQTAIQGSEVRVSAPSRDELQGVIQDLKGENWGMELKFGNYR
jgi:cyclic-di-GMP-binding protein